MLSFFFFFFKQKTAYEMLRSLVGSEMCIRDRAGTQAQMVVENANFKGDRRVSELVVPRCTYTIPEVAGTGSSEAELVEQGVEYDTFTASLEHNDRAILEGGDVGFCKILVKKGTSQILGATIVAETAGDFISEITLSMQAGVGLDTIGRVIHPYPCLLYTSDAADEEDSVDLGGRRIIKKKKKNIKR
eukprot:TRINITY_DN4178_c0_g1_i51.p1 TRINITY_DN4178_c0_g1~~TRINITY_DN4178_c0_g1_i51.p1  ORF type:complete len:188 (-),score=78.47 TRINITY_DN4178_c0_g1_i51:45-608(-)